MYKIILLIKIVGLFDLIFEVPPLNALLYETILIYLL